MKHAFSNFIKCLVAKLLAYLVSTFCKYVTKSYSDEKTFEEVYDRIRHIAITGYDACNYLVSSKEVKEDDNK